ncbi:MAG: hypothetical protein ACHQ4H_16710, partial [Ktedonobacterales bacterium]
MMPCPRCGYPCQVGIAFCSSCQLQLTPDAPHYASPDQMPNWVRSMQAGQSQGWGPGGPQQAQMGPAGQMGGPGDMPDGMQPFAARSLMNEDALPDWLRQAASAAPPPQYGGGTGGLGQGGWQQPPGGGYGQDSWQQQPQQPQQQPPAPDMTAQRFFDESNLPDWIRQPGRPGSDAPQLDAYPTLHQPGPHSYAQAPQPAPGGFAPSAQAGGYQTESDAVSGLSLLDAGALPGWMRGEQVPANGNPSPSAAYRDAGGMRGQSLVDDASLPAW